MINRKLVETPVRMMNRMEELTDLICEYNEEVQKQQQEIERLNKEIEQYKYSADELNEINRLNNIIKEVREIFKDYGEKEDIVGYTMYNITGEMLLKLLDILDKGSE